MFFRVFFMKPKDKLFGQFRCFEHVSKQTKQTQFFEINRKKIGDYTYRCGMGWALAGRQVQHKSTWRWTRISAAPALVDRHPRYTKKLLQTDTSRCSTRSYIQKPQVHTKALIDIHIQVLQRLWQTATPGAYIKALIDRHIQMQGSTVSKGQPAYC